MGDLYATMSDTGPKTITISNTKGSLGGLGLIDIVSDESVRVTCKRTEGNRIYVNPTDYNAMKEWRVKTVLNYLSMLQEEK